MYVPEKVLIFFAFHFERNLVAAGKRESEWWIVLHVMNLQSVSREFKKQNWILNLFSHDLLMNLCNFN